MSLHKQIQRASQLREQNKLKKSFDLLNQTVLSAAEQNDYKSLVAALSERSLVYKHYFEKTQKQQWLELMKADCNLMLDLVEQYNLKLYKSIAYFRLGEVYRHGNNYAQAAKYYRLALKYFKGPLSQKGDWRYHLGAALYFSGKEKQGMKEFFRGVDEIKVGSKKVDSFLYHVWQSGAYMQLAQMLAKKHKKIARGYLQMAKEIINSDRRLIIRRQQIKWIKI